MQMQNKLSNIINCYSMGNYIFNVFSFNKSCINVTIADRGTEYLKLDEGLSLVDLQICLVLKKILRK